MPRKGHTQKKRDVLADPMYNNKSCYKAYQ